MLHQNWFQDKKFEMFEEYADSQSFYDTENGNIYVVSDEFGQKGSTIIQEIIPDSFEYAANYARYKAIKQKEYHVILKCSEEYNLKATDKEEAEKLAREKFGCDYLVDNVIVQEV